MATNDPLAIQPKFPGEEERVKIRRGRIDSLDVFELKESELETLERGTPADLYLNFAIFLISQAVACVLALVTAEFKQPVYQTTAIVFAVVGIIIGAFLLLLWYRVRKDTKAVIAQIRARIKSEGAATPG